MRHILSLTLLLGLGVVSCQVAPPAPIHGQVPGITGQVHFDRSVAATVGEVASGATVSLIDATTGTTVATTVTTASGGFTLNFGPSFTPTSGVPYVMEAVKGLAVGGSSNRAGATVARLRTILFFSSGNWTSLSSGVAGSPVNIGRATTTVSVIASLRGLSTANQQALVGTLNGSTFDPTGTVLSAAEYGTVYGLVDAALANDQDPVKVISFDASGATVAAQYRRKPANLVVYDNFSPARASVGGVVTFNGQGFPATGATVTVGGVPAATWSANATRTQLSVTLAGNGHSGQLDITQGTHTVIGPFVPVAGTVGTLAGNGYVGNFDGKGSEALFNYPHGIAVDSAGNVYVSEWSGHRIRRISPSGAVTTLAGSGTAGNADGTGTAAQFNYPRHLSFDNSGNLLVGDYSNGRVRRVTPTGVVSTLTTSATFAQNPASPYVLSSVSSVVMDGSGNFYISEYGAHRIWRLTAAGSSAVFVGSGTSGAGDGTGTGAQLSAPDGLLMGSDGNLYSANNGANHLKRITLLGVTYTMDTTGNFSQNPASRTPEMVYNVVMDGSGVFFGPYWRRVVRASSSGGIITYSGTTNSAEDGMRDGSLADARYNGAMGLARHSSGTLYIADRDNHRVRVVVP